MIDIPSPILLIGDSLLSKKVIVGAKKKYKNCHWEIINASTQSPDEIRMLAGFNQFGVNEKIVLIEDIPNKKAVREFLLDLVKSSTNDLKFILWDSNNHIKIDPKTKEFGKTWTDFVSGIKKTPNSKVIDSGADFSDKENMDYVKYIQDCFKKYGKVIEDRTAMVFGDIVGRNRGMILSEVQKLSICCPDQLTEDFIFQNTFPTTSDGVLYKFGNAIDTANMSAAISSLEDFLSRGTNHYVLAEILMKKARWQLVVAHLWGAGSTWYEIPDELMEMGKFPSNIWHDSKNTANDKKRLTYQFTGATGPENRAKYLIENLGIPSDFFNIEIKEKEVKDEDDESKPKARGSSGECLPLRFIAQQISDFVKSKIVEPNKNKMSEEVLKEKVLNKCLTTYLNVSDLFKDIRYNQKDAIQSLYEIIRELTDTRLIEEET